MPQTSESVARQGRQERSWEPPSCPISIEIPNRKQKNKNREDVFKFSKILNIYNSTHNKCRQERSWERPRCPISVEIPNWKQTLKKSRDFFEKHEIVSFGYARCQNGGVPREGLFQDLLKFSTFCNAKRRQGPDSKRDANSGSGPQSLTWRVVRG